MYAVIIAGGQQYRVEPNQELVIEKLDLDVGASIEFDKVLLVAASDDVKIGAPYVAGAKVLAEVVEQSRGKKVKILKFRRRKHHMKHMGHRQYYTKIKIKDIEAA